MNKEGLNIFPDVDGFVSKEMKEHFLKQTAKAIWLTGLSGSGKTSIAKALEKKLYNAGFLTQILDGDNIRNGINNDLNFSNHDRIENIRRVAEISKLFLNCGIITINCFISPTEEIRHQARKIIGKNSFIEVFINTPLVVCEIRDPKGLYLKARKGELNNFTGISAPFEIPQGPSKVIETEQRTIEESANELFDFLIPLIKL